MQNLAIVYDWADSDGGAERILQGLLERYPGAHVYTSYVATKPPNWAKNINIQTTFAQRLPNFVKNRRYLLALFLPFAFESLGLTSYENVIVVTSGYAKGIVTQPQNNVITIVLSPPRWAYLENKTTTSNIFLRTIPFLQKIYTKYFKAWDKTTMHRQNNVFAISRYVAQNITNTYGIGCKVLYPPFDYEYWENLANQVVQFDLPQNYFLVVSRLVPYKQVDLGLQAYAIYKSKNQNNKTKLVVVGMGQCKKQLVELAKKLDIDNHIVWLSGLSDSVLATIYKNAKALVMPQVEDFGYVACEAVACGCPVVCQARGGQAEIIVDGKNGVHVAEPKADAFAAALEEIKNFKYNSTSYENHHIRGWNWLTFVAALSQKITKTI